MVSPKFAYVWCIRPLYQIREITTAEYLVIKRRTLIWGKRDNIAVLTCTSISTVSMKVSGFEFTCCTSYSLSCCWNFFCPLTLQYTVTCYANFDNQLS
jgi:hypothetical protein